MTEHQIQVVKNLSKKLIRFHLLMILLSISVTLLVFLLDSWSPLQRQSLRLSILFVAVILFFFHLIRMYKLNKPSLKLTSIIDLELATKQASSIFQGAAVIGLLLILIGIFIPPLARIVDTGIPILALMGVEFLAHAWMLWIVQECKYRLSRKQKKDD